MAVTFGVEQEDKKVMFLGGGGGGEGVSFGILRYYSFESLFTSIDTS